MQDDIDKIKLRKNTASVKQVQDALTKSRGQTLKTEQRPLSCETNAGNKARFPVIPADSCKSTSSDDQMPFAGEEKSGETSCWFCPR